MTAMSSTKRRRSSPTAIYRRRRARRRGAPPPSRPRTTFVRVFEVHTDAIPAALPASASAGRSASTGKPQSVAPRSRGQGGAGARGLDAPVSAYSLADLLDLAGAHGEPDGSRWRGSPRPGWRLSPRRRSTASPTPRPRSRRARRRRAGAPADRPSAARAGDALRLVVLARDIQASVGGVRAFAPLPRASTPRAPTTGYDDVKQIALARLRRRQHRRRSRWTGRSTGRSSRRSRSPIGADDVDAVSADEGDRGPAPQPARRDPPQHPRRRPGAGRARTAASMLAATRALTRSRSPRRGRLPERPAARLRARAARRVRAALRLPSRVRAAAARARHRPRPDSVDRISARPAAVPDRAGSRRSPRAGRSRRWRSTRGGAARHPLDRDGHELAHVGGAGDASCCAAAFGIDARAGADGARSRRDARAVRRRADHRRHRAVPRSRAPPASTKIDLGEEWTRMTGLPFVYAFWAGGRAR